MDSTGKKRVRINEQTTEIRGAGTRSPRGTSNQRSPKITLLPLIPSHIVDEAFQRMFVVSLFILIQAYKIYDLLAINVINEQSGVPLGKFSFVLKYSFIDGILLWFLPILNISYLTFSPLMTLLLTVIFNVTNILLVSKFNLGLILGVVGPYLKSFQRSRELTVGGDSINAHAIDMDSHFRGKYTIHYLPDSLVKFNVFGMESVCQDRGIKDPFYIPTEFNTTTDIGLLELQYTSPQNQVSFILYGESDLGRLMRRDVSHLKSYKGYVRDDDRVFYLEIPAREPGTYKINKIRDKNGVGIRHVQREFSFAYCPGASFIVPKALDKATNKICVGSKLDDLNLKLPLLTLDGVPPLHATILTSFNNKKQSVIDTEVSVDLNGIDAHKFNFTNLFSHKITRNLLEQEILKNPKILDVHESGTVQFQLLEVKDSLGNVKKYNPQSDSPDLRYGIDLLTRPSLRLIDYDSLAKLLVNGTKRIGFATSKNIGEQLPLEVQIAYFDGKDSSKTSNFTHYFKSFEDLKRGVEISKPGSYKILDVKGQWCLCDFSKAGLSIDRVLPPEVEIASQALMDKCVGMTGYNFKFNAKGEPPFEIGYSVYQNTTSGKLRPLPGNNGRINRVLNGKGHEFEFNYKPPGEGNFAIVFDSLRDHNYKTPIGLDKAKHTYLTYFKQRSRVSFFTPEVHIPKKTLRTCQGESTTIPLYFKGNFPFTFDYSIIDSNTGKAVVTKTKQHTDEEVFNIKTEDISKGGSYKVILENIVDGISCTADYNTKEIIEVFTRSDTPSVEFETSSLTTHHKIVEGSYVEVPLKVQSSVGRTSSDAIEYEVIDLNNSKSKRTRTLRGTGPLKLSEPGIYKLTGFSNGGCGGTIGTTERTIHVSFYDKPQLKVEVPESILDPSSNEEEFILKSSCQGCKRKVTIGLEGKGPFVIDYKITFPSGRSEVRSMTTEKLSLSINLPTTQSGIYRHKFKGVYDTRYTKGRFSSKRLPEVTYEVFESPSIEFANTANIQICEALLGYDIPDLRTLPTKQRGKAPFSLDLSITGDGLSSPKSLKINNVSEPWLDLNNALDPKGGFIWNNLKQGEYEISITNVTDGNGCVAKETSHFNSFVVSVTPAPDIFKFKHDNKHFCVGDHVGYDITGVPPYTMFYEFNGNQHKAKTSSQFRRLAAKTGTIKVSALEDSSAGSCMINIDPESKKAKDLEITIHDLPSVEINQGDSIIQDIHEGEMTEMKLSFTGTPPFTVTYVRTLDPNSKARRSKNSKLRKSNKKITETTTVKDIWDHEYKVMVGLEGTYEAIEIRDAFCMAKKDFSF